MVDKQTNIATIYKYEYNIASANELRARAVPLKLRLVGTFFFFFLPKSNCISEDGLASNLACYLQALQEAAQRLAVLGPCADPREQSPEAFHND
jgi:hypothetical protein